MIGLGASAPFLPMNSLPTALSIGAAGVYPYSDALLELGSKMSRFGDPYNMFRVSGAGDDRRILVPRMMVPLYVKDTRADGLEVSFSSHFTPRNTEQSRVIDEATQLLLDGDNFVVECPTGFGKTACAMQIIANLGLKTLVVVTKEDIRDQWYDAAVKFLRLPASKIGFIQGDRFEIQGRSLVIAMVQSLAKESRYPLGPLREFGLAIWDECHRIGADYFSQSCFRVPAKLRMGLSATPDRKDGREGVIRAHIGPVRVSSEAAPMTPRVVTRKSPWKVPMTSITDPETGKKIVGPIPHTPGRCGHIINMMAKHYGRNSLLAKFIFAAFKKGRHVLIQSDRIEHLETLSSMVVSMGVHSAVVGFYARGLSKGDREVIKTKQIIFATYQMTAEATDIPRMDTLVMATPKSDVRQIVGRILRPHKDKAEPLVLDVIDDSSGVFSSYWRSRRKWYKSVGASVSEPVEEANCG